MCLRACACGSMHGQGGDGLLARVWGHGQNHSLHQLLDLLVQPAHVVVVLSGPLVNLHRLHPRVVSTRVGAVGGCVLLNVFVCVSVWVHARVCVCVCVLCVCV